MAMKKHHHTDVKRIIVKALASATPPTLINEDSPYSYDWNISGDCEDPYYSEFRSSGYSDREDKNVPYFLQLWTRCRHCPACLRQRTRLWKARCFYETMNSPRTWFGTLTLSPDRHLEYISKARLSAVKSFNDFDSYSTEKQFILLCKEIGVEVTKWLKRVRKNSGATLRYIIVPEPHKSGLPHYHCLIHQTAEDDMVTYRVLANAWRLGFTKFNILDDPRKSGYVAKYITKTLGARVRASKGYGKYNYEIIDHRSKA